MSFFEDCPPEARVVAAANDPGPDLGKPGLAITRIVDEAILFDCRRDAFLEIIAANKILIMSKRYGKAVRDLNSR